MNTSPIYIAVSIAVLAVAAVLIFLGGKNRRKENKLAPLAGLAFGYFMAFIDIVNRSKRD